MVEDWRLPEWCRSVWPNDTIHNRTLLSMTMSLAVALLCGQNQKENQTSNNNSKRVPWWWNIIHMVPNEYKCRNTCVFCMYLLNIVARYPCAGVPVCRCSMSAECIATTIWQSLLVKAEVVIFNLKTSIFNYIRPMVLVSIFGCHTPRRRPRVT